ncbi:hypothetical protein C9374_011136 [Naegleria lovaniensis]|uniref:Uncharacterized protein n=1 Tax=Naegleria lovaniensis TaxID=51637 RepID=A0AA88GA13_NAELO|nr:uncharacterized protein C9374_011136 [Naegleria lovaniensis]KAG2374057.1 hypothetical protein C9374_011136 [Naegleria lovaniensis]
MGQRLSLNIATISRLEDLIPISASGSGNDDGEGEGPPDRSEALAEEQQNTIRLKLLKANVVSAATSHHGNNIASSASPKSFASADRRRRGNDAAFKHELGRRPSYSSDNISQPSFGEEQTALILEKMKNIGPIQQFVEQLSNEEKLLKSYLDFNWMTTVALIERSASESMRFLSKGIGDFFNVAIHEMQLKISDSQADLTSMESIHGQQYVEVKLAIVPYIHFSEGSSFSTISFPVLDHFPVDSEDEPFVNVSPRTNNLSHNNHHNSSGGSSSSPLRINVTKTPSKFTLALIVGPWLVFFDPLTSLIIPKKLYGMAKIIASNLPELFITKQKEKLTEKLAQCIVSWNTSKLFKNEKDMFCSPRQNSTSSPPQQSMYGNGIDFIDDYMRNYLNIDYTTFPLVRYFKTFLGNARQQGWSQMVIDLDESLIGKYGPVLTPTTPLSCFDFSNPNTKLANSNNVNQFAHKPPHGGGTAMCTLVIESHEELDNIIKDMMIHDLMENAASYQQFERTSTPETPLGSEPSSLCATSKKEGNKMSTTQQQPTFPTTISESDNVTNMRKKAPPVSHFFIDVLKMFDRAWWMRHLFDVNEEHVEVSTPSHKKHVSTTVQSSGDSPSQIRHTRDYISEIGCPFGHAIPDYEKNLECYPRRRKKKLKQQVISRPNSPSSPNTSRRSITSLSPRKSPSIRSNASPKTPIQPFPQTSNESIPLDSLNEIKR